MKNDEIKWHPAFAAAIELEFKEYKEHLEFTVEHELTQEPLKIDVVIVKKIHDVQINKSIGKIFKRYNIFEYKSPTDYIAIDDYYKAKAYAYLYKALEGRTNEIDIDDVTITLAASRMPKKLIKHLKEKGYNIRNISAGMYYIDGTDIATQLIVSKELNDNEAKYLKILQKNQENYSLLGTWLDEYIANIKNPLYTVIMDVLNNSSPNEILEVYKSMGRAVVSEENIAFLMSELKRLELDKRIKEEGDLNRAVIGIRNMLEKHMDKKIIAELLEVDISLVEQVEEQIK